MSRRYDLHTHTLYSDGTLGPRELVQRARRQGVDVLALTDHDVTDGLREAAEEAARLGLTLVPGVEISVTWCGRTVHVVGLHIDPADTRLQAGLAGLRGRRDARAVEIDRRLQRHGIHGALDGARRLAAGPVLSRTHFARYLADAGHVRDIGQAFKKYLGHGGGASVPSEWTTLENAVAWIRGAGGQAVIAHPARYTLSAGQLRRLLSEFKACGGAAIEVVSGSQGAEHSTRLGRLANEAGLMASVGSDYHGPEKPWVELGRLPGPPAGCTPVWTRW